ncbi:MAG: type II secretion system protein GspE [Candidatus Omnitrophota bacterium]|nr:MAG: type II secretion system protein GspE [Candidatus Omnitrophota bacterium]
MAKIGEILVKKGILDVQQLDSALAESKETGKAIGRVLLDFNFVTERQLLQTLADQLGLIFYPSLNDISVPQEVIDNVAVKLVWHYKIMPLQIKDKILVIAVSDPMAIWFLDDLKLRLGYDIERVLATESDIQVAIRKYYGFGADTMDKILSEEKNMEFEPQQKKDESTIDLAADSEKSRQGTSVIKLVNQILSESVSLRATDIHLEPYRDNVRARHRIDGVLYDINVSTQIKYLYPEIVSRIKILSGLNVIEKRLPQDGRAIIKLDNQQVDLRISVIPSIYGEGIVIRILPMNFLFSFQELGFSSDSLSVLENTMQKPYGIIFLTGPTGSGKTTTLYTCLNKINTDEIKIITIEDPVEYELNGIMQIHVKPNIGFTFARALRSILRHDPDVMMVGEVRDLETAELAIRTALTGHRMFSTLHTNDAASGATRLIDLGIEPFLIASSVNAFISQRLVRKICLHCKEEVKKTEPLPECFKGIKTYKGKGCDECNFIGYKGRTVIYEILPVLTEIQQLILNRASSSEIRKKADELGLRKLIDVGIEKVRQGITTPEEILKVTKLS